MSDDGVLIVTSNGVTTVRLNRPQRRNALDTAAIVALGDALAAAEADAHCRVLRLEGTGGHFCAGRDLDSGGGGDLSSVLAWDEAWTRIYRLLRRSAKPSVAVVEGYAVAGGFTLAMAWGVFVGTYSSIFVSAPILLYLGVKTRAETEVTDKPKPERRADGAAV